MEWKRKKQTEQNRTDLLPDPISEAEANVVQVQRAVRKKSVLLVTVSLVLIAVVAALAIAWYTRLANTYAVTFDVADYDLAVNNNVDDEYLLNVYDYSEVKNQTMAPGTIGWIPMEISAFRSDVDISYSIELDSKMPEELKKRIRYFYLVESDGKIHYGDAVNTVAGLDSYTRRYLCEDMPESSPYSAVITDNLGKGEKRILCLYWEWYYDAQSAYHTENSRFQNVENDSLKKVSPILYDVQQGTISANSLDYVNEKFVISGDSIRVVSGGSLTEEYKSYWDVYDTDMGIYPEKYRDALYVTLHVSGGQIQPSGGVNKRPIVSEPDPGAAKTE